MIKPQNNSSRNYIDSFINSTLTLPLLLDTLSIFSPPSFLSGKLLSPFLISVGSILKKRTHKVTIYYNKVDTKRRYLHVNKQQRYSL